MLALLRSLLKSSDVDKLSKSILDKNGQFQNDGSLTNQGMYFFQNWYKADGSQK